jgi:UDP-N-acetyl-2-amino-2-deoxyglucuronate dehydrogenase
MTLKFGIIGAGNIAPIHATAIQNIPDSELVAVADNDLKHAQALVAQYGGVASNDYHDLLARPDVDVVTLCVPHYLHAPMTLEAAAAGKHVLCEKPMAISLAECDTMIAACEKAGVTLGVVFQGRFEPLAIQLKAAIDSGELGRILWVSANTFWHRTDAYYRSGPWRGTWAHEGGGVLINQAIHALDLLVWLAGSPSRVSGKIRTLNHQIEVEDCALASLEYENGQIGLVQASTIAIPGYPERIEIYGSQGSAIYHKGLGKLEWHFLDSNKDHTDEVEASNGAAQPMDISPTAHIAQFKDFAEAVRNHGRPKVSGKDGRLSIELMEAIYRSSRQNAPIDLPFLAEN